MPPDAIRHFLNRQPFQPFRLYVLETTVYEIDHPEMVAVGKAIVTLLFRPPHQRFLPPRRVVVIATLHVSKLEDIEPAVSGNGQAGQGAPA